MEFIFYLLLLIIVIVLGYLFMADGKINVSESLIIRAPGKQVFDKIRDFKTWKEWSPWILHEPEAKLNFKGNDGEISSSFTWDGKLVGSGTLTHVKFHGNKKIDQNIRFFRPFKSSSQITWRFDDDREGTKVTWSMNSKLPFFMKPMKGMMENMISKDYKIGLNFLNMILDPDAKGFKIQLEGSAKTKSFKILSESASGSIKDITGKMKDFYPKALDYITTNKLGMKEKPICLYTKMNPKKMMFDVLLGVSPEKKIPVKCPFKEYQVRGGKYFKVVLVGEYQNLEFAWYVAFSHVRMAKMKYDRSRAPYEFYLNDPRETQSKDLLTAIHIPIK